MSSSENTNYLSPHYTNIKNIIFPASCHPPRVIGTDLPPTPSCSF